MDQTAIYLLLATKLIDIGVDPTSLRVEVYRDPRSFNQICRGVITRNERQYMFDYAVSDADERNVADINGMLADRAFFLFRERFYPNRTNWIIHINDQYEEFIRQRFERLTPARLAPVDNFNTDGVE